MRSSRFARLSLSGGVLALCLALAGCGEDDEHHAPVDADPAMAAAIEGPLMTDPDLSQKNMGAMAAVPGGPIDPATPLPDGPTARDKNR